MKILLLNQAFYPDSVSTSQHVTDIARELCSQGHEITVLCARRDYKEPRLVWNVALPAPPPPPVPMVASFRCAPVAHVAFFWTDNVRSVKQLTHLPDGSLVLGRVLVPGVLEPGRGSWRRNQLASYLRSGWR